MTKPDINHEQKALLEGNNFSLKRLHKHGRFDVDSVSLHAFMPWTYFTAVLSCLTLYWPRYEHPYLAIALVWLLSILFIGNSLISVVGAWQRTRPGHYYADLHWPVFSLAMMLIAWGVATSLGQHFYWNFIHKYYDLENLQEYGGIDPSVISGKQIQDAGRVYFTPDAYLDRRQAGCYVKKKTYCIAPIVFGGNIAAKVPQSGSYDYFAVGTDCCSCPDRDYRCGEYNNPLAAGGLRHVNDEDRVFFKLAVDSWKSTYTVSSVNPMFFEWTVNPRQKQVAARDTGLACYILTVVLAFVVSLMLAISSQLLKARPGKTTQGPGVTSAAAATSGFAPAAAQP